MEINSATRKIRQKGKSVREEKKGCRSEGKPYLNNKNVLVEGKTGLQEEVSHILLLIKFVQI